MAYTVASLTTEVRQLLNESDADNSFWTDTEIANWIKLATIDLSTRLHAYQVTANIPLVTNQWSYTNAALAGLANAVAIEEAWITTTGTTVHGLANWDLKKLGHTPTGSTTGKPTYIRLDNRTVYIWPPPNSTYNAKNCTIVYASETDNAVLLDDEHQPLCILYACAKAKQKDHQFQDAAAYMDEYNRAIQFELGDKAPKDETSAQFKQR